MSTEIAVVLSLVVLAQAFLYLRTRRIAGSDDSARLQELEGRFRQDIEERSKRGQSPDWLRYQGDIDRVFQTKDERLRTNAAAALALGLAGTIFALLVSLYFRSPQSAVETFDLVEHMGAALIGSLLGVIANLLIVLILIPRAEDRFDRSVDELHRRLQAIADVNRPQVLFTEAIREELATLRQSLQSEFATAFSKAITGFPDVVKELGEHASTLAQVVETQGQNVGSAIAELKDCATLVATSGDKLRPAAEQLQSSTTSLQAMPGDLKRVLEESRAAWLESLREDHQKNLEQITDLYGQVEKLSQQREEQMLEASRRMLAAVGDVRAAVERIPGLLSKEVEDVSGRLGIEFGRQARDHINELHDRLEREHEQLVQRIANHEQEWRNNIGEVVRQLFAQVSDQVDRELIQELQAVSRRLGDSTQMLPEVTRGLESSHKEWTASQQATLLAWREAGNRTQEAARSLLDADGQLRMGVESLKETSDNLSRVSQLTAEFQHRLAAALSDVTTKHLDDLRPMHDETAKMMQELRTAHGRLDGVLVKQTDFIKHCIELLLKGRSVATLERQV